MKDKEFGSMLMGHFCDTAIDKPWVLTEKLSHILLGAKLGAFNDAYSGRLVTHIESQGAYRIERFSVLNKDGISEFAVNYHPYDENTQRDYNEVLHVRPASEFFDGRFTV